MINKKKLAEFEQERTVLKTDLMDIEMEIARILAPLPEFWVYAWDGSETYEDGRHKIDAPVEMVEKIEEVESGHKGNIIRFKGGKTLPLEDYFSEDEIGSIRKY